jgi:hypothetical protein
MVKTVISTSGEYDLSAGCGPNHIGGESCILAAAPRDD